jgi:uncharacterized protein YkwD
MNFTSADSVHQALMNSPSHKKNLLNPKYDEVGLAMATGYIDGKKTNVLVEFFSYRKVEPTQTLASAEPVGEQTTDSSVAQGEVPAAPVSPVSPVPAVQEAVQPETEPVVAAEENEELGDVNEELTPLRQDSAGQGIKNEELVNSNIETEIPQTSDLDPQTSATERVIDVPAETREVVSEQVTRQPEVALNYEDTIVKAEEIPEAKIIAVVNTDAWTTPKIISRIVSTIFVLALAVLVMSLLANIFIRFHIQHKGVILQTLALIVFVGGLIYFKVHFLESGVGEIFLL